MQIAITGHLGFIGSHLAKEFKSYLGIDIKDGNDVRCLHPNNFEGIDYVFHLAAQPKVQLSIDDPLFTNSHNIDGTLNVLWCAKEAGVKRVIYSASSSAYGEQEIPLREDMKPNPMSPYAIQKLTGEYYCKQFYELYGLETVSLRYFNVYGEDMPLDSAYAACIAIFLDKKKKEEMLPLLGGKQTRDFTYVKDVVRANILAMKSDKVGHGEVINIGTGKNYSIKKIANTISDKIEYLSQRKGEPMDTLADNTKAKRLLNWKPTQDVIQWLLKQS